jgi:hypothetical protein
LADSKYWSTRIASLHDACYDGTSLGGLGQTLDTGQIQMQAQTRQSGFLKGINIRKLLFTITLILIASVAVRIFLWPHGNDKPSLWLFRNTPHLIYVNVVSGPVFLTAGENRYWTISVDPGSMSKAHVVGIFQASGGPEDDIQVALAEASEFEKWKNGHEAKTLYFGDQITSGKFDVRIPEAGTYILSFRNTSPSVSKKASAEIMLRYLAAPVR